MKRTYYHITLTLKGPILTKSSSPSAFGVDSAFARIPIGENQGKPFISGTHIKGKLLESLIRTGVNKEKIHSYFGTPADDESYEPLQRGRLHFSPLIASHSGQEPAQLNTRIQIDTTTGSVKSGALLVEEMPFAHGEEVEFSGTVSYLGEASPEIEQLLYQGFNFLTHVGSNHSIGYGRFIRVNITLRSPFDIAEDVKEFSLAIKPQGPLCITRHRTQSANLFESSDIIPGNMIAGALMETAKAVGKDRELRQFIDSITFRHAWPCHPGKNRPRAIPYSIVALDGTYYDAAGLEKILPSNQPKAPTYQIDWKWKDFQAVSAIYDHVSPFRELIVRTAIDSEKGTADRGLNERDGKLFAWEVIHPYDGEGKPIVWKTRMGFADTVTPENKALLAKLLGILSFVSKTKAPCEVRMDSLAGSTPEAPTLQTGDLLTLVLQTPALLADPYQQKNLTGAISAEKMQELYQEVWLDISEQSLALETFLARQEMAGGEYLCHRFQAEREDYYPWILTSAGSIFTLRVTDAQKAQTFLKNALLFGLTPPKHHQQDNWQNNPYLPQNGFGEIQIHQPHFSIYPHSSSQP